MNWSRITKPKGTYYSNVFYLETSLEKYLLTIKIDSINVNHQKLDFFYSISNDNLEWIDWKKFTQKDTELFMGFDKTSLYFKFKVEIESDDDTEKPYLQSISFYLDPFFTVENSGDLEMKPKIWIRKTVSDGNILLGNKDTNQTITLKNLRKNEEVYLDSYDEDIVSTLQGIGVYRYDDHNDEWLILKRGLNDIYGHGNFDMDIRLQNIFIQE